MHWGAPARGVGSRGEIDHPSNQGGHEAKVVKCIYRRIVLGSRGRAPAVPRCGLGGSKPPYYGGETQELKIVSKQTPYRALVLVQNSRMGRHSSTKYNQSKLGNATSVGVKCLTGSFLLFSYQLSNYSQQLCSQPPPSPISSLKEVFLQTNMCYLQTDIQNYSRRSIYRASIYRDFLFNGHNPFPRNFQSIFVKFRILKKFQNYL